MERITALILAAGEGKRMKSKKAKVVHKLCGKAMVDHVYSAVKEAGIDKCAVIIGHMAEDIKECLGGRVEYVLQENQLGTGHAVMQAEKYFADGEGLVFVLYGDAPLVTTETILRTVEFHKKGNFKATVITAEVDDPTGYGRIIRDADGNLAGIVEHRDATEAQRKIREMNSGLYLFSAGELYEALRKIDNKNDQGEYYLTDVIGIMIGGGIKAGAFKIEDPAEVMGVNDRVQLYQASEILRERILRGHMLAGVTMIDPKTTFVEAGIRIGRDTVIYPNTILEGRTTIGEDCIIGPNTRLAGMTVGNGTEVVNSIAVDSSIGDNTKVGPFAYIRPESNIGNNVKIGDFVEVKKSKVGARTKIPHLAYVGDAEVGENTNVGCGVIVANYDGRKKSRTVIGNNVFVGSNSNLVAPVTLKDNSFVAAGSTITDEVPENALAIARCRQVNKEEWVTRKGMQRK